MNKVAQAVIGELNPQLAVALGMNYSLMQQNAQLQRQVAEIMETVGNIPRQVDKRLEDKMSHVDQLITEARQVVRKLKYG